MALLHDIGSLLRVAFAPADDVLPAAFTQLLSKLATSDHPLASGSLDAGFKNMLEAAIPQLRARARSLTREMGSADDLVQDALLRAWDKRHSFQPATNFSAWIYTIMRNLYFTQSRRKRFVGDWDEKAAERLMLVLPSQEHTLHLADVAKAFSQLAPIHREVLMLVGGAEMSYEDAAQACGVKVGTMKSRASRARAALLELIDGKGEGAVEAA